MAPENLDRFLDNFDPGRRNFLRRIIAGAAFAPPLIASFSLAGPSLTPAEAAPIVVYVRTKHPSSSSSTSPAPSTRIISAASCARTTSRRAPTWQAAAHPSLNFKGSGGSTNSTSSTWLTVFDATTPLPEDGCQLTLSADILINKFNNSKGAGLLALFNEAAGKKGLALLVLDAGNTDVLQLVTVDQTGKRGGAQECLARRRYPRERLVPRHDGHHSHLSA